MSVVEGSVQAASAAGLHYVSDERPGIRRRRRGRGWEYVGPTGVRITKPSERERIAAIAIPPAWTDVWISPDPLGHILAVGRDARGRKQYCYHPLWREVRDTVKFDRMAQFGAALPELRQTIDRLLGLRGLPRERVLAAVVSLLDRTLIRVGNPVYAETNGAFGLTTLRSEHVEVGGHEVSFDFTGKGGVAHEISLRDRRLAAVVQRCEELGGQLLFTYLDEDDEVAEVNSSDVNTFLRELSGEDFTAKDFRTWGGTVEAARTLVALGGTNDPKQAESNIVAAVDAAAERLGNTRAVARSAYVHPVVPQSYLDGELAEAWKRSRTTKDLDRGERSVLRLLVK